jgi:hypothetical protein
MGWKEQKAIALLAIAILGTTLGSVPAYAQGEDTTYAVTVAAGDIDRQNTVVSFPLPSTLSGGAYHLEGPSGRTIALQVGDRTAWFVLDRLRAGAERTYHLEPGSAHDSGVKLRRRKRALAFAVEERPVLQYWTKSRPLPRPTIDSIYRRGGYVHPIRTPSGRVVTGDYPSDHLHHHGLWAAWTKTQFRGRTPDFWNMGEGTGAVVPMALDSAWSGPVHGGMRARHRYVDERGAEPITALYEAWTLRVYDVSSGESGLDYRMFDLTVEQTTASASPLILSEYHYGGVALRGRDAWYGPDSARFLTSKGKTRANGNETRARWTYMGGEVDGKQAGIAMLGHPTNVRAPQPVRIHPKMPYFCFAPTQLGTWMLAPGRPYRAHYRFVVFDGPPDTDALDRLWSDYAYPPTVTVKRSTARRDR